MNKTTKQTARFLATLVLLVAVEAPISAQGFGELPLKVGPSLRISSFTATPDPAGPNEGPRPGDKLLYDIKIFNDGPGTATNVTLDLDLPPELSINDSQRSGTHWDLGDIGDKEDEVVIVIMDVAKTAVHDTDMTSTATAGSDYGIPRSVQQSNTTTVDGLCDSPPASGTWFIDENCTFNGQAAVPEAVEVKVDKVLSIAPGAILEIDLQTYRLTVKETGGVMVKDGGTIRDTTGTL